MTPSRPYLLRGFYDWIVENHCTPYIVINTELPEVYVPEEYIENGRIVLNVDPNAVKGLLLANDHVEFNARFSGIAHDIWAPMKAVSAIYAKENGRGMVFKEEEEDETPPPSGSESSGGSESGGNNKKGGGRSFLTLVK
jgi:stringent starvation protein B